MAPAELTIGGIVVDLIDQLVSYHRTRLPSRQIPGFVFLWFLQRLAYHSGWKSPRLESNRVPAS
jgi:hypothetical protein